MAGRSDSEQIDDIITLYGGWKAATLTKLRAIIKQADPMVLEEVKWRMKTRPEGLPVWSHDGIMCIAETFKDNIKLVFFKGVFMKDPQKLFNARLNSKTDRAIEFKDGDINKLDEAALTGLVHEAIELNEAKAKK